MCKRGGGVKFASPSGWKQDKFQFSRQSCLHDAIDASRKKTPTLERQIDDILATSTRRYR
jgi:hypothetical protein